MKEQSAELLGKIIEHYPGLQSISKADFFKVLPNVRSVRFKSGTVLFEELQACRAFPFVLNGEIRVFKRSENGREILLYNVGVGDACVVSAACLFGNAPYNAIGIVQSDCEVAMMPSENFDYLMSIKTFRNFIFSLFSKRVVALMELIDEVAFRRLDQRLAKYLFNGSPELSVSHQELADELGTAREMISRILGGFSDQGLVKLKRGSIQIADAAALKKIFESGTLVT